MKTKIPIKLSPARLGALAVASALSVVSCQPDDNNDASIKSLDNLTRGDGELTVNKCGVSMNAEGFARLVPADRAKLKAVLASSDAAGLEASGTFMAVPKPLQRMFFAAGGKLRVVKDSDRYCKAQIKSPDQLAFASEGTASIDACWNIWDGDLEVIVRDNKDAISHSLVRVFGYVYTQFFAKRAIALKNDPELQEAATKGLLRYKAQSDKLGAALLQDLADDPLEVRNRFTLLSKTEPDEYKSFVVADSIDSYYCSPKTRQVFQAQFPATWAAFTQGELALVKDLGEPFVK